MRDETFDSEAMPDGIQDALLIYNPTSGRRQHRRFAEIEQAVRILKDAGVRTEVAPTNAPMSATAIARQAVQQGRGIVIACGGDAGSMMRADAGADAPVDASPDAATLPPGVGHVVFTTDTGRVYRVAATSGAPLEDVSAALDAISAGRDAFINISRDASLFDQRGCMSPQTVYVAGKAGRALRFTQALAYSMSSLAAQLPRAPYEPVSSAASVSACSRMPVSGMPALT